VSLGASGELGRLAWCDGAVLPADEVLVSAFDRTLVYGLGAFETFRLEQGRPVRPERHLARLERSLASVALPVPPAVAQIPDGVRALARAAGAEGALCRVTVTAGPLPADGLAAGPRVVARLRPLPPEPARPVVVGVADFAHDPRSPLAGVKSTNYLVHYLLHERARAAGRLDDLMVDAEGHVREGTVSSLFVVREGTLLTPPVSEGILEGVTRATVLELARGLVPWAERPLRLDDLGACDELFLTGSGKGLVSVDEVDGRRLPAAHPVADALGAALRACIERECGG